MNHIEHVGHQRVIPGCSTGLTGLRGTRAVAGSLVEKGPLVPVRKGL